LPKSHFTPKHSSETWAEIELDIQKRGNRKDKKFILSGKWKKFVKMQNGFKLFSVDGKWIRDNLSISFNHGGHGLVHEFIPLDEIWVDEYHHNCDCRKENKFLSSRCEYV